MIHCDRCVMPNTRPGLIFEGRTCQACLNYEKRREIDWEKRWNELRALADLYKEVYACSAYDCVIGVSGGKDSYFITHLVKEKLGMRPLLVRVADGFSVSEAGEHNLRNLVSHFNCDLIEITPKALPEIIRRSFEEFGNFPYVDYMIYTIPNLMAERFYTGKAFFGENPAYEYGSTQTDSWEVKVDSSPERQWLSEKFGNTSPLLLHLPKSSSIYLSYFAPWSGYEHYLLAKGMGFIELEWERAGNIESYDQMDSVGWQVSHWLKFQKYGYGRVTDIACRLIREGRLRRGEAIELVRERDHKLDPVILADFLLVTGYTEAEFYEISDKFANRELLEKIGGEWRLRSSLSL